MAGAWNSSPTHLTPVSPFIYIIWLGGDILICHEQRVGSVGLFDVRGLTHMVLHQQYPNAFRSLLFPRDRLIDQTKGKWDKCMKGDSGQRNRAKESAAGWLWGGLEEDELTDRQITEHSKQRQMGKTWGVTRSASADSVVLFELVHN